MSSINRFPWQDDILRGLQAGDASSIDDLADVVAAEGAADALRRRGRSLAALTRRPELADRPTGIDALVRYHPPG